MPPVSKASLSAAGLVGQEVGRCARRLVTMRGRERCLLRARRILDRAAPLIHDLAQRTRRRQVGLLDPVVERVGAPRRVGEAPVALGRCHAERPTAILASSPAELCGRAGNHPALAERTGQGAPRLRTTGQVDVLPADDRFLGLGVQNGHGADHRVPPDNS